MPVTDNSAPNYRNSYTVIHREPTHPDAAYQSPLQNIQDPNTRDHQPKSTIHSVDQPQTPVRIKRNYTPNRSEISISSFSSFCTSRLINMLPLLRCGMSLASIHWNPGIILIVHPQIELTAQFLLNRCIPRIAYQIG